MTYPRPTLSAPPPKTRATSRCANWAARPPRASVQDSFVSPQSTVTGARVVRLGGCSWVAALGRAVAFGDLELVGQPAGRLTGRRAPRFSRGCHVKIALPLVTLSVGTRQVTCPEGREGMAVMASCGRRTGGSGSRCVALHAVSSESCRAPQVNSLVARGQPPRPAPGAISGCARRRSVRPWTCWIDL